MSEGSGEVAGEGSPGIPTAAVLSELHALCATTAATFREGHKMTVGSHEHSEKVLVWLIGLMGAGVFSVQGLLAGAPLSMRLSAFVPWMLGIVCGIVGRLLGEELRNRDDQEHFRRISTLELLQLERDPHLITEKLRPILESATRSTGNENRCLDRLLTATNAAFYLTHICLAVGVVAAMTTVIVAGR